jgi:hypothetical protein
MCVSFLNSVVEPNGALRTVQYTADDRGFNPIVSYSTGHPGGAAYASVYSSYAPAFVSDKRVQIVDKFTGPPPALNIQPFALPSPSGFNFASSGPVVVPAPLRAASAPRLVAQALNVNYAPAFMPHLTAFATAPAAPVQYLQQAPTFVQKYVQPAPVLQQQYVQPAPVLQQQYVQQQPAPVLQQYVRQQAPIQYIQQQAPVAKVLAAPVQQKVYYQQQQQPAQVKLVAPAPVKIATPVVDSYAAPPRNTIINPNAQVYPDARKPEAAYGPPNFVAGEPIGLVEQKTTTTVVKSAPAVIAVSKPVQYLQPAPVTKVHVAPAPTFQYVQQAQVPVATKVLSQPAPVLGLYAGAVGFHTQSVSPSAYLHSYGTQGYN